MKKLASISDSLAGRAAMLAGAALAAEGVTQIVHSQHSTNRVVGVAGHLVLGFFVIALIAMGPSFIALARRARPGIAGKTALAMAAATTTLGLTCITSLVHGRDYGMFNAIAPITNLVWLFGSVILAVALKRAGKVPTAIAVGLVLSWFATIPLATLGGGVLSGGYFLAVGYLLTASESSRLAYAS